MDDVRTPKKHSSLRLHRELNEVWSSGTGFRRLAAVNHTVIGKRFMVTALVFFAIGGFLGMLIRTQLATSSNAFMDAEQYAQVFTMHGTIMMFLFAIPFLKDFRSTSCRSSSAPGTSLFPACPPMATGVTSSAAEC